jgi:negative regulator of flagellin synthesis FlgM
MDIKNLGANKTRADQVSRQRQGSTTSKNSERAGSAAQAPSQDDSLELTAVARAFSAAQTDATTPPFDTGRVQEIRSAIAEGRYPIDNRRLADKIIDLEGLLK